MGVLREFLERPSDSQQAQHHILVQVMQAIAAYDACQSVLEAATASSIHPDRTTWGVLLAANPLQPQAVSAASVPIAQQDVSHDSSGMIMSPVPLTLPSLADRL